MKNTSVEMPGSSKDGAPGDPTAPPESTFTPQGGASISPPFVPDLTDAAPSVRSRFTVLELHAQGGLGRVSLAQDEDLRRRVALKEIRPEWADNLQARSRFLNEAEITGQLEHPGIVPIYALGLNARQQPYYAMRFIQGQTLGEAIRAFHKSEGSRNAFHALAFRDLLRRFIDVCQAIAYAHSKGILHRDLKPSNIMLGAYGETLVLDWGLAKRIGTPEGESAAERRAAEIASSRHDTPHLTQTGDVLGTPAYMSPEQAAGQTTTLAAATDIFALGAILYELLTGQTAYYGVGREVLERIREGAAPAPRRIKPSVPLALEAVCRKAMSRNPSDRYASAAELARDVERWLADEPVVAYREPLPARAARWGRRHRTLVTAAMVLLVTLVAALTTGLVLLDRKQQEVVQERNAAHKEASKAQAINHFLIDDLLAEASPERNARGKAVTVEEVLRKAAQRVGTAFADQPEVEASVQQTIGRTYHNLGLLADALPHYQRTVDLYDQLLAADHKDRLAARRDLGHLLCNLGRWDEAEPILRQSVEATRRALGVEHEETRFALSALAELLQEQDKLPEAEALCREALEAVQRVKGAKHPDTVRYVANVGRLLMLQRRTDDAEPYLREAYERGCVLWGEEHPDTLISMSSLAFALFAQGKEDEAESLLRRAVEISPRVVGADHPDTQAARHNLAGLLTERGRGAEAEPLYRQAFDSHRRTLGDEHPETLITMMGLGANLLEAGKWEEAEPLLRENLRLRRKVLPEGHPDIAHVLVLLGRGLNEMGRALEAETLLLEALAIKDKAKSADTQSQKDPVTVAARAHLGRSWTLLGRYAEAEPLLLANYEAVKGVNDAIAKQRTVDRLVKLYEAWGKPDQAAEWRAKQPPPHVRKDMLKEPANQPE